MTDYISFPLSLPPPPPCRRQSELVTPVLFDVAVSGNSELLFKILENGDDVNPSVNTTTSSYTTITSSYTMTSNSCTT